MSAGRIVSTVAASLAVAGCAVVAIGMARADSGTPAAHSSTTHYARPTPRPAHPPMPAAPTTPAAHSSRAVVTPTATPRPSSSRPVPPSTPAAPVASVPPTVPPPPATHAPAPHTSAPERQVAPTAPTHSTAPEPKPVQPAAPAPGQPLPLSFHTHRASEVITVVARSHSSTTAHLQAWTKVGYHRWRQHGRGVTAYVGSDGLGNASEYRSATPIGSFTLTRAFGHYSDPGTALPYLHTTPSDWWISQAGPLYNTHQRCSSGCSFNRGSPNEHLYYETPYYNYAVVIDYNTRNAPGGVQPGRGSAFFLHVTVGAPTAGCVAIPQTKLVHLLNWLRPERHPRILIGVK